MKRSLFALLFVPALLLAACQTSSLTEEESAPVVESEEAFSGEMKEIDMTQSVISFEGASTGKVIRHEGKIPTFTADVSLDPADPADLEKASITAEIDLTSIVVDAEGLQAHLQREDFFDTAQHPTATFVSTKIASKGDNMYKVMGDLTIKGKTMPVTIDDVEITDSYLVAHYDLQRAEFGIGNESYGEKILEPTVPVDIKLVFNK